LRRSLDVNGNQTLIADQRLGLFAAFGIRGNERSQGNQTRFVELTRHMGCAAPVLGTAGAILRQPLVQIVTQVLTVEYVNGTAHVEQLALDRIGQSALARAGQAAEQHGGCLLAEARGTLLGRYVCQTAMLAAAMGDRVGDEDRKSTRL